LEHIFKAAEGWGGQNMDASRHFAVKIAGENSLPTRPAVAVIVETGKYSKYEYRKA
jgi:hypothetical protein